MTAGDLFDTQGEPPPRPALPDAEARRTIADDLDATLFVEAAAGTGKTTVLVGRIVALLRTGRAELDRLVAVTFTDKAAGEMKLRLRAEIETERAAADGEERANLDRALEKLELARIGTIHSFCGDLLRERPVEAGVDPLFEVAAEDEGERLLDRAFDGWFQAALESPPRGVERILRRRTRGNDPTSSPRAQLRRAARTLVDHRDFDASWLRKPFDRDAEIAGIVERIVELAALAPQASRQSRLVDNIRELERFAAEHRVADRARERWDDHDGLEAGLRDLRFHWTWRYKGSGQWFGKGIRRDDVIARRDTLKADLDAVVERCDADLAALLRDELRPVVVHYGELLRRSGRIDFLDLLMRARDLVREDREVRAELQERFTHFFVDEFQDTDPLQAELLLLLASTDPEERDWRLVRPVPGKLFVVGDPKQSIYRFRRADVSIYEATKERLAACGASVLHLTTSFRAVPAIQSAVNAAFRIAMRPPDEEEGEGGGGEGDAASDAPAQARYVALERFRRDHVDQPAVVALPVPRPYNDWGDIRNFAIDASLPHAVGAFVDWVVRESGWTIEDRGGERTPIRSHHICILFRRLRSFRDDVTRPYIRALEARRVPHVLVGGRSFHDREEVIALRAALSAIEWPGDELSVYATLHGPLFSFDDDSLVAFRHRHGKRCFHPLRRFDPERLADGGGDEREAESDRAIAGALGILGRLHRRRNRTPIAGTIAQLLGAVRAHAGIAIWPTGEQALANCLRVIDHARKFERGGAPSFRAFVERLEAEAERRETADAPVVEEGTEGVRIMTVHRAKGLEFPVVILADPTCNAVGRNPSRKVDADAGLWAETICGCVPWDLRDAAEEELAADGAESVRLTYVATTRARDLLVVPVIADDASEPPGGWLGLLRPAVFPEWSERREARPAPGCPAFGNDGTLERPERAARGANASVAPGLHRPAVGEHGVVFWDPRALDLDKESGVGLRQERILAADEDRSRSDAGAERHAAWRERRDDALARGSAPTRVVGPVTKLAAAGASAAGAAPTIELHTVEGDRTSRPGGRRFGTLVHNTLATVELEGDRAAIEATAKLQGRIMEAPADEIEAATAVVERALGHPILRRAAAAASAGGLRRETPILLPLPDGTLAEGILDLAIRDEVDGVLGWTVVDFKTDRDLGERRPEYERQVGIYIAAIAEATGEPTRGALLLL